MLHVKATKTDGNEWHPVDLYDLSFSYVEKKGCEQARVSVPQRADTPDKLSDLEIWDGFQRIWIGRVEDEPEITDSGEVVITALGPASQLSDRELMRVWSDTGYSEWGDFPVAHNNSWNFDAIEKDNNNRLFFRVDNGKTLVSGSFPGLYYGLTNRIGQNIFSVTFNYEIGANVTANGAGQLYSYTSDLTGSNLEWSLPGNGTLRTGSQSITLGAGRKALYFCLGTSGALTATTSECYVKITNVRVNAINGFEAADAYTGTDVVEELLGTYYPGISTDYSDIVAGQVTLTDFHIDDTRSGTEIIDDALSAEDVDYGFYEYGSDGLPREQIKYVNREQVDWFATQDVAPLTLSGRSIEEMYNQVIVEYDDPRWSRTLTTTRTYANAGISDPFSGALTREKKIRVNTTSLTTAQNMGDRFLVEFGRNRIKGEAVVTSRIRNRIKGLAHAWHCRPGETIFFHDLDPNPETLSDLAGTTPLLNGRNVFRILAVNVDAANQQVTLQLDTRADKLEFML